MAAGEGEGKKKGERYGLRKGERWMSAREMGKGDGHRDKREMRESCKN